jgi:hypothetical protein
MAPDTILGVFIIVGAITAVLLLYVWSWRRIETIHRKGPMNLRQIQKELRHGRGPDATS